jgi:hypothetical protein
MVDIREIEVVDVDEQSRQELDPDFLRSGYQRKVYVSSTDSFRWRRPPHRTRVSQLLVPIPLARPGQLCLTYEAGPSLQTVHLEAGRYYYLPPGVAFEIESEGAGVLEVFSRVYPGGPPHSEERLPDDYFQRRRETAEKGA